MYKCTCTAYLLVTFTVSSSVKALFQRTRIIVTINGLHIELLELRNRDSSTSCESLNFITTHSNGRIMIFWCVCMTHYCAQETAKWSTQYCQPNSLHLTLLLRRAQRHAEHVPASSAKTPFMRASNAQTHTQASAQKPYAINDNNATNILLGACCSRRTMRDSTLLLQLFFAIYALQYCMVGVHDVHDVHTN